ncbi:MAG: hypothetical protein SF187_30670 [Deltaproteobacteria bacterium]|nr:hypothetical protein [Deltaproteobacteria bacterium]
MIQNPPPLLLFVDGIDGSGKSTWARQASDALRAMGTSVWPLSVDDFRTPVDWHAHGAAQAQAYYDEYFDLQLLDDVLRDVARGQRKLRLPVFTEGHPRAWQEVQIEACDVVLLEGVFTQRLATAAGAGLVYVDVEWALARERILVRDQAKGRTASDVNDRIDQRYIPGQRMYEVQCRPRSRAHWVATFDKASEALRLTRTANDLPPHPLWPQVEQAIYKASARPAMNVDDA